jgi:hypothetical protein
LVLKLDPISLLPGFPSTFSPWNQSYFFLINTSFFLIDPLLDQHINYLLSPADPVAFRHQIGGVRSRLMEMRDPCRTPEIDYEFYNQNEYISACKSTGMKAPPSNTHIIFSSPCPLTSPIKMSPLCEDSADDKTMPIAVEEHSNAAPSTMDVDAAVPAENALEVSHPVADASVTTSSPNAQGISF